jgi:RimJ/RimL family protein N-acetyltransferase
MLQDDPVLISSPRLHLRRLQEQDLRLFQDYRTNLELARYQAWKICDDESALEFLRTHRNAQMFLRGRWCQLGIALKDESLLIGDIGICLDEAGRTLELGITLNHKYHGYGYATEALAAAIDMTWAQTEVEAVIAITDARNVSSLRLLERLGMIRVETFTTANETEEIVEHAYQLRRPAHP